MGSSLEIFLASASTGGVTSAGCRVAKKSLLKSRTASTTRCGVFVAFTLSEWVRCRSPASDAGAELEPAVKVRNERKALAVVATVVNSPNCLVHDIFNISPRLRKWICYWLSMVERSRRLRSCRSPRSPQPLSPPFAIHRLLDGWIRQRPRIVLIGVGV